MHPADASEVAAVVLGARERGGRVKAAGTGHSFTGIATPEQVHLRPDRMQGVLAVDRERLLVTAAAGTRLADLNLALERLGLSLHNMGDIAEQTLAGAISTGTHGAGGRVAGLAGQLAGLELVTGTGEILNVGADARSGFDARRSAHDTDDTDGTDAADGTDDDLLDLVRVGLGALGVITTVTFNVEPLFLLRAEERPMGWADGLAAFDDLAAAHDHLDVYWFPHTDRLLTKGNTRVGTDLSAAAPLPAWRAHLDDEFLANTVFGAQTALLNRAPRAIPAANRLASRLLGAREYTDVAHRVFTAQRRVVFREMEYALPREVGLDALREARTALDASGLRISFPVEVRVAPGEDAALATAHGRDSLYLAFHTHRDADHRAYFALLEPILRAHGGRPHWGKLHSLEADDLAPLYPRFEEFTRLRDRLDPDRVFANRYLERVLGA